MDWYYQLKSLIKYVVNAQSEYLVHLLQIQMTKKEPNRGKDRTTNACIYLVLDWGQGKVATGHHIMWIYHLFIQYLEWAETTKLSSSQVPSLLLKIGR